MIKYGIISALIGLVGGISRGTSNLSKGEASASYNPSSANNFLGYVFSLLLWGGILLIIVGIIFRLKNKGNK